MKSRRIAVLLIMFLYITSCQREVSSCNCNQIEIYGYLTDINFPIRILEKDIRERGVDNQIEDSEKIDNIKNLILSLELLSEDYNGIDVSIVMDLICINGGKLTILLNGYIVQVGNNYFEPNERLIELITKD